MDQVKLAKVAKGLNLLFISGILAMMGMFVPILGLVVICGNICALIFMQSCHRNYMFALAATLLRTVTTILAAMKAGLAAGTIAGIAALVFSILEIGLICLGTEELVRTVATPAFPNGSHVLLVTLIGTAARQVSAYREHVMMLAMMSEVLMLVAMIMAVVFYHKTSKVFGKAAQEKTKESERNSDDDYDEE